MARTGPTGGSDVSCDLTRGKRCSGQRHYLPVVHEVLRYLADGQEDRKQREQRRDHV